MRAAAQWQRELVVPNGASPSATAARLSVSADGLSLIARGQHGWLADAAELEDGTGTAFTIGVDPARFAAWLGKAAPVADWLDLQTCDSHGKPTDGSTFSNGCHLAVTNEEGKLFHYPLMDGSAGFWPAESIGDPTIQIPDPDWSLILSVSQLRELLKLVLFAAADPSESAARAVVILQVDGEELRASGTDGRLIICARTSLLEPLDGSQALALPKALAERLLGVVSLVEDDDKIKLDVAVSGSRCSLRLSFGQASCQMVAAFKAVQGPDLSKVLTAVRDRTHLATVSADSNFRARLSLLVERAGQPIVLTANGLGLCATSRVDADAALDKRFNSIALDCADSGSGQVAIQPERFLQLLGLLRGSDLELSVADNGYAQILVAESAEAAEIDLMAALVGLNVQLTN